MCKIPTEVATLTGIMLPFKGLILLKLFTSTHSNSLLTSVDCYTLLKSKFFATVPYFLLIYLRKRRYLGRYFAHPMMQNRRAKRDDYKPSAVRVTQRCVP
ncbi:hypothetical protein Psal182_02563 [Piscirickettsia salmonis]|nr:hypothetical protein Psal182_02563 [Piscirickettsia salmonis]